MDKHQIIELLKTELEEVSKQADAAWRDKEASLKTWGSLIGVRDGIKATIAHIESKLPVSDPVVVIQ